MTNTVKYLLYGLSVLVVLIIIIIIIRANRKSKPKKSSDKDTKTIDENNLQGNIPTGYFDTSNDGFWYKVKENPLLSAGSTGAAPGRICELYTSEKDVTIWSGMGNTAKIVKTIKANYTEYKYIGTVKWNYYNWIQVENGYIMRDGTEMVIKLYANK